MPCAPHVAQNLAAITNLPRTGMDFYPGTLPLLRNRDHWEDHLQVPLLGGNTWQSSAGASNFLVASIDVFSPTKPGHAQWILWNAKEISKGESLQWIVIWIQIGCPRELARLSKGLGCARQAQQTLVATVLLIDAFDKATWWVPKPGMPPISSTLVILNLGGKPWETNCFWARLF